MTVFRSPQKMRTHFRFSIFFVSFSLISIAVFATALPKESLGIAPEDEKYFKSEVIKCKDGSKKFSREKLNDGFCDCPDGTDEPGTSACPEGKFYCRNVGHVSLKLFSSRVNDGICDCCDGSDEYNGKVSCPNTCWEAGKVARDKLKKKIATYQDGVTIRKREVEQAKQAIAKDEAELAELKSEEKILKELVKQLKDQKEQIERAEEQERKEKEKEEERQREANKTITEDENHSTDEISHEETKVVEDEPLKSQDQDTTEENIDLVGEPEDDNHAGDETSSAYEEDELLEAENNEETIVEDETGQDVGSEASPSHEEKHAKESTENTEGLSKEELGRLVASRWTGENAEQKPNEVDGGAKEELKEHEANHEDDYEGYSSEADGNSQKYGEDEAVNTDDEYDEEDEDPLASYKPEVEDKTDFSDITTASTPSWSNKIQQAVRKILQAINLFKAPVDTSEAARVRKEYDDYSSKLSKLQSRITSLTKKLSNDYGPNKEFYSFYDHCFENKHNKYIYKVCPFKEATQGEDYSTTRLGRWDKFEDSYRSMHFLHGDKCWNGPDRSLKVKLRCGLKNELTDVDEPSRCEYVAMLSTPVVCLEERLKELQHKLDVMNTDQQQMHDEL